MFKKTLVLLVALVMMLAISLSGCVDRPAALSKSKPSAAPDAPAMIAERGDKEWDYVVLGDSVTWGFYPRYAEMLEQDLGVQVRVHNKTKGGDHSSALLERLRTDTELRQAIREAEVITFEIPWGAVEEPCMAYTQVTPVDCGGPDGEACLREGFGIYQSDTKAIMAELVALRSPAEALIRTMDTYQFQVPLTKETGTFDVINRYWREANAHVIEQASRYDIPTAPVYDAFMGESGKDDPVDKGLIVADSFHTSREGGKLIAELFRELGYSYASPAP